MSISNSREFLAYQTSEYGAVITDHAVIGRNVQLDPGLYVPNWDTNEFDSVTFAGSTKGDALFGGGGEVFDFFMGTRGDDLYGVGPSPEVFTSAYVDYSGARTGVFVDMTYTGTRTFTDADGEIRTVKVVGKAHDGFGGTDYYAETPDWGAGYSSIVGVFGSSHRDVMIEGGSWDFYGGGGDDLMIGGGSHGGTGNDWLIGKSEGGSVTLFGDEGNDWIFGTDGPDRTDVYLIGGAGSDRIFAGAGDDRYLTGDSGNDFIDAGTGDDYIDGGVGKDTLSSGAGSDTINPDVEFFQQNSSQPRDGARDVIQVTEDDLGAFTDYVLFNSFEEGRDRVSFGEALRGGTAFGVSHEDNASNPGRVDTVLQIDADGDGLGGGTDADDYYLRVAGADLSLHGGYILT